MLYSEKTDETQVMDTESGADFMLFVSNTEARRAFFSVSEAGFDYDRDLAVATQVEPSQSTAYLTANECFDLASALVRMGMLVLTGSTDWTNA